MGGLNTFGKWGNEADRETGEGRVETWDYYGDRDIKKGNELV